MTQPMTSMRTFAVAATWASLFSALVLLADATRPAHAFFRTYNEAWCTDLGQGMNDCSYFTLQQCRAAASGNGNFCYPNPRYAGPPPEARKAKRKVYRD
jgi:hypothetical protein